MTTSVVSSQVGSQDESENDKLETECVFRGFLKSKASQDRQDDIERAIEGELEADEPSLINQQRNKQIGSQLAAIADQLDVQYRHVIDGLIDELKLTSENAYDNFAVLARRLLARGVTWGNIVVLFCFGYRVILRFFSQNIPNLIRSLSDIMVRFVVTEKISQWVKDHGGWIQVLNAGIGLESPWYHYGAVAVGLISIVALVVWWRK